jgi:putative membrane protein
MLMRVSAPEKRKCAQRLPNTDATGRRDTRRRYAANMKLIVRWLLQAAALLLVAHLYSGVQVESYGSAMLAAFVIGLFNTLVRPLLVLLTLPVTVLTLGLFLFVINALMFWGAASLLDGFGVTGFWAALLGSLLYSLCGMVIDSAMERVFGQRL